MIAPLLILANTVANTLANICLKRSAGGQGWKSFWSWQIAGNLIGFCGVMLYTATLQYLPMSVVFPITQGLSVLGVQVIAARYVMKERIRPAHWIGTALIIAGIILVGSRG